MQAVNDGAALYPQLPSDRRLELRLLGALIIDGAIPENLGIKPDDLNDRQARWIFERMLEIHQAGHKLKVPLICEFIAEKYNSKRRVDLFLTDCLLAWSFDTAYVNDGEAAPIAELERQIKNLAFQREREIIKNRVINAVFQNDLSGACLELGDFIKGVSYAD